MACHASKQRTTFIVYSTSPIPDPREGLVSPEEAPFAGTYHVKNRASPGADAACLSR
jgi:hypothetical protein